jgi:hypothetical protein
MFKPLLMPLLCSLLALACQPGDDPEARNAELTASPGLRIEISGADLSHETVHAIAQHLEGNAKDNGAAMVRIKKENDAAPTIEIELWGGTIPATGDVAGALKAQFPALAAATITASTIAAGEAPSVPIVAVDDDLSPAEAEQQIRDQLAADGVEGDVKVNIEDGPEGRRVEVNVKKTGTP